MEQVEVGASTLRVVPMKERHVAGAVEVHIQSFPGFFLTSLGPRFLRLMYSEILRSSGREAFVVEDGAGVVRGFVVGVAEQVGLYTRLARQCWAAFALASLGAAIRRPIVVPRLVRAFARPASIRAGGAGALLLSIGVAPEAAGQGLGRELVSRFLSSMKDRGVSAVSLTTDRDDNDRTNRFYLSLGFRVARTYVTYEGRWMNEYVKDLGERISQ
jgi:ribosomal protein S18 acetylase RimI-like enzyme